MKTLLRLLLLLAALLYIAILELGKHVLAGWLLAAVACAGFFAINTRRKTTLPHWAAFLLLMVGILWLSRPPVRAVPAVKGQTGGTTEIVHVEQGDLTGVRTADSQVEVFTGIPYAKPPVGDLRWKEPQPADPWDGVLAADHFAPMSMQTTGSPIYDSLARIVGYHDYEFFNMSDNYVTPVSEDSLYLNIWRPASAGTPANAAPLPVLVYIHGGSLQTGQPWYEDYRGENLARQGIIVVNIGYRLGVFGFYADEDLAKESPNATTGNYGLLDQIAALQWVQKNIAAFGGDPNNVTLAGESAGSACVTALCTSPLAKGLFRRAVGESSTVTAPQPAHSFRTMDKALEAGLKTKQTLGAATLDDLRSLPAEKLVGELSTHHHMTVDGYVLPETPCESYAKGIHNEEAQMHGYNREESAPFILFSQANLKNYEEKIAASFDEPYRSQVLDLYPAETDAQAKRNWADIYTAVLFTYGHYCWERLAAANGIPSYTYYFTKENGRLGSWHSGEEVYLYGNIPPDSSLYTERDKEVSQTMQQYYLNFIRTGDPNGEGLPEWPAGSLSSAPGTVVMEFGEETGLTEAPFLELYEILDRVSGVCQGDGSSDTL